MEFLYLLGLIGLWIVLMKWVLPRFQVSGCRSAACGEEHARAEACEEHASRGCGCRHEPELRADGGRRSCEHSVAESTKS
jgi:hypothetical protein